MNDNADRDELPELSDEDIELLHAISKAASASHDPPFKALFAAYDAVFAEQGIEQEHDGVVFRLLLRVGETARERGGAHGRVDLVGCLKSILEAQGITVLENEDEEGSEVTRSVDAVQPTAIAKTTQPQVGIGRKHGRRRVSFDDARLDETWLSENTQSIHDAPLATHWRRNLLSQPARRGRPADYALARRARSTSSQRSTLIRHAGSKDLSHASPSTAYTSNPDDRMDPVLLFQPSQTELEQNAKAFLSTSVIHIARHCLHAWHYAALLLHQSRQQAFAIATAHDHRTLLKQALDTWHSTHQARQEQLRIEAKWEREEKRVQEAYNKHIMGIAFRHWALSTKDQQLAVGVAKRFVLRLKYFRRWRQLAADNAVKVRSVLARKWISVWREKAARRQLREEQAVAFCEESRVRRCWSAWFWHFCSRRMDGWHEQRVKKTILGRLRVLTQTTRDAERRACKFRDLKLVGRTMQPLRRTLVERRQLENTAAMHDQQRLTRPSFSTLKVYTRLGPIASTLTLKVQLNLQRRAFRIWSLQSELCQQAARVDHKRVLQSAWTSWNDALRCRALGQRIDERVLIESLYKWVLAERLKLFEHTLNARLAQKAFTHWRSRLHEGVSKLEMAEAACKQSQRRRTLASGMVRLHLALRQREDAERAALEFTNARALPNIMHSIVVKVKEVKQLEDWASRARFYSLCTRALAVWRERTTQQVHVRRRDAYARIRARVKIRIARSCFSRWRERRAEIIQWHVEAERRTQEGLIALSAQAFVRWRDQVATISEMEEQAKNIDRQKLLLAALAAVNAKAADSAELQERAVAFRQETDLAVLSSTLKKLQWEQFTAVRRSESADALWARNRDQHMRQMLRHWFAQTNARKNLKAAEAEEEPDSPSLRPASRAASRSRSAQRLPDSSPPAATPAYMRTPSRPRRAGRFRPLPTPAALTPFAFDSAYLATTPAPLPLPAGSSADDEAQPTHRAEGAENEEPDGTLTLQVTPFARKLRAGGFAATPVPSALRSSAFGRSTQGAGGTSKSVRFAGRDRFQSAKEHEKAS